MEIYMGVLRKNGSGDADMHVGTVNNYEEFKKFTVDFIIKNQNMLLRFVQMDNILEFNLFTGKYWDDGSEVIESLSYTLTDIYNICDGKDED